jgi:hypothetical protein
MTLLAITVAALRASAKTWPCPVSSLSIRSSSAPSRSFTICREISTLLWSENKSSSLRASVQRRPMSESATCQTGMRVARNRDNRASIAFCASGISASRRAMIRSMSSTATDCGRSAPGRNGTFGGAIGDGTASLISEGTVCHANEFSSMRSSAKLSRYHTGLREPGQTTGCGSSKAYSLKRIMKRSCRSDDGSTSVILPTRNAAPCSSGPLSPGYVKRLRVQTK